MGHNDCRTGLLQIVPVLDSDEAGVGDARRQQPAVRRRDGPVVVAADHEGGHIDAAENGDARPGRDGQNLP